MIVMGIDSDLNGGTALYDTETGKVHALHRMPVLEPRTKSEKRRLHNEGLMDILLEASSLKVDLILPEKAITKPQFHKGKTMNTKGIDTAHQTYGGILALCEAVVGRGKVQSLWPSSWKKKVGVTSDKQTCLDMAVRLFPTHASLFGVKRNAGIAEALIIAYHYEKICT